MDGVLLPCSRSKTHIREGSIFVSCRLVRQPLGILLTWIFFLALPASLGRSSRYYDSGYFILYIIFDISMFGSSFGASLPSSGGGSKSLFPKSGFSGATLTNNDKTEAPSLPFAGFGGAAINSKPSSTAANKPSESGGFNFGGSASTSSAPAGDSISSTKTNLFASTSSVDTTNKSPPTTSSSSLPISGFGATKSTSSSSTSKTNTSSFAGAASKAAASASKNSSHLMSSNIGNSSALVPTSTSTAITTNNNNKSSSSNYNNSLESSCISPNGRSFHSYLYDTTLQKHVIVSEFAPFGDTSSGGDDNITPRDNNEGITSSLKITTVLPILVQESIAIDNVLGLLCVDGNNDNDRSKQHMYKQQQQGEEGMKTLPTLCLYTSTSVFLLTIGYTPPDENDQQQSIQGKILQSHEPFEKQLLMSPSNSSIIRIRSAPQSNSMFSRNGSIAMLLREGGKDDTFVGYVVCLYHGLPANGSRQSGKGGRGEVTTPLRFNYQDLVRGLQDTVDAENAAYNRGGGYDQPSPSYSRLSSTPSKSVVDFCFNSNSSGFSSTSILILCNDGSVYGASPIIFDGAVLPRTTVMSTISQLNDEIEASSSYLQAMSQTTPAPTTEHEGVDARLRQCRAARRYLLDVFGIPEGMVTGSSTGGSYYVSASVVHTKSYSSSGDYDGYSQALSWQPRLQGPIVMPPEEQASGSYSCIESFGGTSGAGIIDGFVVARTSKGFSSHVEVGILPGEGAVILPRFEFESDSDCQLIDDIVRGTGMYVESASIMNDVSEEESGESTSSTALTTVSSNNTRDCSIVVDPLDDIMLHLVTNSRIVTVTTNAVAVTANCFKSRADGTRGEDKGLSTIRTKVWSELEVSLTNTTLVGACVSGDVHLGHIMLARVSNGK